MVDLTIIVRFNILAVTLRVAANFIFELRIQPDTSPHTVKKHILIRRREDGKEPYNRKRI